MSGLLSGPGRDQSTDPPEPAERCAAAHSEDPTGCEGPMAAVRILDALDSEVTGCVHHGARMYASLLWPWVYSMPGHDGAALEVYRRAQFTPPFAWTVGTPGVSSE